MPSPIPDRFRLELRLGRDDDVEEWLATDVSLDRPVLIRALGPETSVARREEFVGRIGAVAGVSHPHLAKVFMVEQVAGGAYAVVEWTGGSTIADHVAAERTVDLAEFLPNATGLSGALAALHERDIVHGAIDPSAISYAADHPAKLGGFGRRQRTDMAGDVRDLAASLETALTGGSPGGPPPSESIDGVTPAIDSILRNAQDGGLGAAEMEKALSAAPTPRTPAPQARAASRRLIYAALALIGLATALIAIGLFFSGGSTEPVLPSRPTTTVTTVPTSTTTSAAVGQIRALSALLFDPFGNSPSEDPTLPVLIDGDATTSWAAEALPLQISESRPPFGVMIAVLGSPARVQLVDMTRGTQFELRWSATPNPDPAMWETVATAQSTGGTTSLSLATRSDGQWLIWFTALPAASDGTFRTSIAEVRFLP